MSVKTFDSMKFTKINIQLEMYERMSHICGKGNAAKTMKCKCRYC